MEITLLRTGGIIPILKKASINVDLSEKEINALINLIEVDDAPQQMRDNTQYQILYNQKSFSVDLEKLPEKYKKTFENLKNNLKIVRP